uniref:Venom peptide HtC16x n=1 Tax=Hadogenes troglodytes TaxID=1577150 RepID=A0A1B3IJ42_9SCOR|nr:venom peptide HtC16x [Hadogenes troglodytes]
MKSVYFVLVVVAVAVQLSSQDSCHMRELDLCVATTVIALRDSPVPKDEKQIDEQCNLGKETTECVKNYTDKCTTQLQRELVGFATQSGQETFNKYCTPGSDLRKAVLERSECLSQAWEEQRSCMTDAQAAIEYVYEAPIEKRLDVLCCAYTRYRNCGIEIARKKCGDDVENFINEMTGLVVGNLPSLVCNDCGKENDRCNGLLPPPGTPPNGKNSDSPISQLLSAYLKLR